MAVAGEGAALIPIGGANEGAEDTRQGSKNERGGCRGRSRLDPATTAVRREEVAQSPRRLNHTASARRCCCRAAAGSAPPLTPDLAEGRVQPPSLLSSSPEAAATLHPAAAIGPPLRAASGSPSAS